MFSGQPPDKQNLSNGENLSIVDYYPVASFYPNLDQNES